MKRFTEGNGYICIKTVQKRKSDTIMKTTHRPKTIIAMREMRALMLLPLALMLTSIILGVEEYDSTKEAMRQDLTHALRHYVLQQSEQHLLADALPTLDRHRVVTLADAEAHFSEGLTIDLLKDTSHISLCLVERDAQEAFREKATVSSDTLLWKTAGSDSHPAVVAFKAYANPSVCSILSHSDQRLPLTGIAFCLLLWGMLWKKRQQAATAVSRVLPASTSTGAAPSPTLTLTPMQEQLMDLFAAAPDHTLTKDAICAALWPKKDHPENTLYTFISRLKTTLKRQSDYDIVNKRGREYQLTTGEQSTDNQDVRQM